MKNSPVVAELSNTDGTTDRHDETNSHFSQFCEKILKTDYLTLYREIIAVCSEIHPKHINGNCQELAFFVSAKCAVIHEVIFVLIFFNISQKLTLDIFSIM